MKVLQIPVFLTLFLEIDNFWRRGPVFTDAKMTILSENSKNLTSMLFWGTLTLIEPVSKEKLFLPTVPAAAAKTTPKNPGPLGRFYPA